MCWSVGALGSHQTLHSLLTLAQAVGRSPHSDLFSPHDRVYCGLGCLLPPSAMFLRRGQVSVLPNIRDTVSSAESSLGHRHEIPGSAQVNVTAREM